MTQQTEIKLVSKNNTEERLTIKRWQCKIYEFTYEEYERETTIFLNEEQVKDMVKAIQLYFINNDN